MKYKHCFDVRISNDFHSDIEDFDQAFAAWSQKFTDNSALRMRLLNANDSLEKIAQGIEFIETLNAEIKPSPWRLL